MNLFKALLMGAAIGIVLMATLVGWVLLISWMYAKIGYAAGLVVNGAIMGCVIGFLVWMGSPRK